MLLRLAIAFKGLTDVDGIEWANDTDNLVTLQYYAGKPVFLVFMSEPHHLLSMEGLALTCHGCLSHLLRYSKCVVCLVAQI